MKNIHILPKFITNEECNVLAEWIEKFHMTDVFDTMVHPGTIRRSTRFALQKLTFINYPSIAYEIQERLYNTISKLNEFKEIKILNDFYDGMYASKCFVGDSCKIHTDPVYIPGYITYHVNVMLSDHENGDLVIEESKIKLSRTDAIFYPVSLVRHSVTKLTGKFPRLFWNFGFLIK